MYHPVSQDIAKRHTRKQQRQVRARAAREVMKRYRRATPVRELAWTADRGGIIDYSR